MAWINRISITLCALPFTTLPLTPMVHTSKQARKSSATTHIIKKAGKKRSTATTKKTQRTAKKIASKGTTKSKTASSVKKSSITVPKNAKARNKHVVNKTASANFTEEYTERKGYKSHCVKIKNVVSGTLIDAHKAKMQKATEVTMNKLMQQIGKPYRWGGSSSRAGFDCNGPAYYAYEDLVKVRIPRTTNEVYHLHDAASIERSELKNGNLAFFRTQGRDIIDRVGVYIGNGKSIQLPRTGQEIQITPFSEDY